MIPMQKYRKKIDFCYNCSQNPFLSEFVATRWKKMSNVKLKWTILYKNVVLLYKIMVEWQPQYPHLSISTNLHTSGEDGIGLDLIFASKWQRMLPAIKKWFVQKEHFGYRSKALIGLNHKTNVIKTKNKTKQKQKHTHKFMLFMVLVDCWLVSFKWFTFLYFSSVSNDLRFADTWK